MSEREVFRLVTDLRTGNNAGNNDLAQAVRAEMQANPQQALRDMQQANARAGSNAEHFCTLQNGDIGVTDLSGRPIADLGVDRFGRIHFNQNTNENYNPRTNQNWQPQPNPTSFRAQNQGLPPEQREVGRLANDLAHGYKDDAVAVANDLLRHQGGLHLLASANQQARVEANQLNLGSTMEQIGRGPNGDLAIIDRTGRPLSHVGDNNNNNNNRLAQNNINPGYDTRGGAGQVQPLDQRYNPGQNPAYNQGFDQQFNPGQNPAYNQGFDQQFNPGQNPAYNRGFDQQFNPGQNPAYNRGFDQRHNPGQNQAFERERQEIARLANDLARGITSDAVPVLQDLMRQPGDLNRRIDAINQLADRIAAQHGYTAREHIGPGQTGDVAIINQYGREIASAGYPHGSNDGYNNRIGYGPTTYAPSPTSYSSSYENASCLQQQYFQPPCVQQEYYSSSYGSYGNSGGISIAFGVNIGGGHHRGGRR